MDSYLRIQILEHIALTECIITVTLFSSDVFTKYKTRAFGRKYNLVISKIPDWGTHRVSVN